MRIGASWKAPASGAMLPVAAATLVTVSGCSGITEEERQQRRQKAYIYYCDGAGGGALITNWSGGIREGMIKSGYEGGGEVFRWNTGLGVVADQNSSVEYKRGKARELANKIVEYQKTHADAPVILMGLSAGTSIVVFTLEELPPKYHVDDVFLFGSSVSSTYDLTRALGRVEGKMYVYTSEQDTVLQFLVPMAGTADRASGDVPSAGLSGFRRPARSDPETRKQYAKLVHVRWQPSYARVGWRGGHTDSVSAGFVQEYVAPHIIEGARYQRAVATAATGMVPNPDYQRWAMFGVGSYVTVEGYQKVRGEQVPMRITATLQAKHRDRLIIERKYDPLNDEDNLPVRTEDFYPVAQIMATEHPSTHPQAKITELPKETVTVKGKRLVCDVKTIRATGDFKDWGNNVVAKVYLNEGVPGHLVRIDLTAKLHKDAEPFEFSGTLVDYKVVPEKRSARVASR
ncbi:MAG: hypothetical protein JSU68_07165 [Phycisphaerales bacterium]|nr:MAG: hypothetical protein JSU68_07165 [Phycisphaerales bacterium]